jgi:hypothetical protein
VYVDINSFLKIVIYHFVQPLQVGNTTQKAYSLSSALKKALPKVVEWSMYGRFAVYFITWQAAFHVQYAIYAIPLAHRSL